MLPPGDFVLKLILRCPRGTIGIYVYYPHPDFNMGYFVEKVRIYHG